MKKRILAAVLAALLIFTLSGCGKSDQGGYKVIAELNREEFRIAFRADDPLCEIITAAMQEAASEGQIAQLSSYYLGKDYSCMDGIAGALSMLEVEIPENRAIRIGIQDGMAPLSSSRDDGSFTGLIPDLIQVVMEKLGWEYEFMVIGTDNIAVDLASGNVDCAWLGASVNTDSTQIVLSPSWLQNTHDLVVRQDSGYSRMNSLKGKVLGVIDSTSVEALKSSGLYEKAGAVWFYEDMQACMNALAAGNCDALVIDGILTSYYVGGPAR